MSPGFVYILRCADGSYYAGSTIDLGRRVWEHDNGFGSAYTRRWGRRPVTLVWSMRCSSIAEAFAYEKRIRKWSRAKREALIRGDLHLLPELSKKDFSRRAGVED